MFLLDSILLAPLNGVVWLGRKIRDVADQEINDPGRIKAELMSLQMQLELGQIGEREYTQRERDLLERLDQVSGSSEERPNHG